MKQPLVLVVSVLAFAYVVAAPRDHTSGMAALDGDSPRLDASPSRGRRSGGAGFEDALVLERDGTGQFNVAAEVNGQDTQFLVDTGADMVAITVDEAERLGVDVDPSTFEPITKTASGVGNGAVVTLDRLEFAGSEFRDVEAVVIEGLEVNLLGQTILRQLGQLSLQGDRMVIRR
jgi:aspartyl protease family protein